MGVRPLRPLTPTLTQISLSIMEGIINTIKLAVVAKDKVGPEVIVSDVPEGGSIFSICYEGFWYRGHVTDLEYRYIAENGVVAYTHVTVTIDDTVWAEHIEGPEVEGHGKMEHPARRAFMAGLQIGHSPNFGLDNMEAEWQKFLELTQAQ